MLFSPIASKIIHPYSDSNKIVGIAQYYDLREVMSEKLRAMFQRSYSAPRDYYDVWYLSKHYDFDWAEIKLAFDEKMKFKNLSLESMEQIIGNTVQKTLKRHWHNSLGVHLPLGKLPDSMQVFSDLNKLINNIFL